MGNTSKASRDKFAIRRTNLPSRRAEGEHETSVSLRSAGSRDNNEQRVELQPRETTATLQTRGPKPHESGRRRVVLRAPQDNTPRSNLVLTPQSDAPVRSKIVLKGR